jgi:solute carrier family 25 carnitine/acylcarnitine transporter 20/29
MSKVSTGKLNQNSPQIHRSKYIQEFSCSILTGIVKVSVIQPFDFVRYRIQSSKEHKMQISNLIKKLVNKEGMNVFFKGLNITTFGVMTSSIVQFTLYQEINSSLINKYKINPQMPSEGKIRTHSILCAVSGFLTGISMALLIAPIDNIRIKLQSVQNIHSRKDSVNYRFKGSLDCIEQTYKTRGIKGLYVALPLSIMRESLACTIYFGTYEYLKNKYKYQRKVESLPIKNSFFYGAFAGGVNWILTLPIDTVKTKLISDTVIPNQTQYKGIVDCASKVYSMSGISGFYKGFSVVFLRALIVNGVVLTSFDLCRTKYVKNEN